MVRQVRQECARANYRSGPLSKVLALIFASVAAGQTVPAESAASLRQAAEKRAADWEGLAKTLDAKVARMLPCDARVVTAIEEVRKASDTRLDALVKYFRAAAAEAKGAAELANKALTDQQAVAAEIETERAEGEQQRAAIDGQLADLAESVKRRPALEDARNKLVQVRARIEQRIEAARQESAHRAALTASLQNLASASEARATAIEAELGALLIESARWTDYYAARLARAHSECSITNQTARPAQRKKQ